MANLYLKNAAILTAASLILRASGMLLRIFLANGLGSEGMGVYQLVFTVYGVSIAAATGGLSVVSTRLLAEAMLQGAKTVQQLLQKLTGAAIALGIMAGIVQYMAAPAAARWLLGDVRGAAALRVLSFSLPFMAVGAVLRGYFMAAGNVRPNVLAQMTEQTVRITMILWILQNLPTEDLALSIAQVTAGNTASEAVSCGLMIVFIKKEKRSFQKTPKINTQGTIGWKKIAAVFWPVEGSRLTSSLLRTAETSMVPACLALYAGSRSEALSQFGALRGMAMPLLTFPFSFLGTLSGLLMPEIARVKAAGQREKLQGLTSRTMEITCGISLFAGAFFTLWSASLGQTIYHNASVGEYLLWLGPVVPFMYLESMVDGIMKGIGEQLASFHYELLNFVLRFVGILLLLPRCGIGGYAAIIAVSNIFTCVMNLNRMLMVLQMHFDWGRWIVKPGILLFLSLLACMAAQSAVRNCAMVLRFVLSAGAMALCYAVLLWCFGWYQFFKDRAK